MRPGVRIGVDVGSVRVGVARCGPDALLATPVDTYPREAADGHLSAADRLVALAAENETLEVVVGLPVHLSGAEGESAKDARAFASEVASRIRPIPVRLVDERLTTVEAHRALRASGRPGRRHRGVVDQVAAVMILQSALDAERDSGLAPGLVVGARKPRHRRRA